MVGAAATGLRKRGMRLVDCSESRHAGAILAILNHAIESSTAIYDYVPRPAESMPPWFAMRRDADIPVIGVENDEGELLGFATWGPFRPFAAFKYSVEHSLYVHHQHRGTGLGSILLGELITRAQAHEVHSLVGAIDAQNRGSIRLHEKHGFKHAGTIREAGFKFGRWLDLAYYQRLLDTPARPTEDV